jgi:hypothetical protein
MILTRDFKRYLDSSLNNLRKETVIKQQNTEEQVLQLQRSKDLSFSFKGNKLQFEFNAGIIEKSERAVKEVYQEKVSAKALVEYAIASLKDI